MSNRRPYILFFLAVLFTFAAFSWWTFSLVTLKTRQYNTLLELIEKEARAEELLLELNPVSGPLYLSDTIFINSRAGALSEMKGRPDAFLMVIHDNSGRQRVVPNPALMENIRDLRARKAAMYISEGLVFFVVLSLAIWWVFLSLSRIVSLNRQQNNFMLSVTHELKTPLAGIKLAMQSLLRRELPQEKQRGILSQAVGEVDRLNNLIEDILAGIGYESGAANLNLQSENLSAFVENTLNSAKMRYNGATKISSKIQPGIEWPFDNASLHMAINNLLDNAVKYSDGDAEVDVTLIGNETEAILQVSDAGRGIPEKELRNVTRKFYRIENEETRQTKGTGLGLYLTKEIVKKHGGKLILAGNKPKGTVVKIILKHK